MEGMRAVAFTATVLFVVAFVENPALCVGFRKAFSNTKSSSSYRIKMATNHFIPIEGGESIWV